MQCIDSQNPIILKFVKYKSLENCALYIVILRPKYSQSNIKTLLKPNVYHCTDVYPNSSCELKKAG